MLKRFTAVCLLTFLALFTVTGCSEDNSVNPRSEQQAPSLPDASTMSINLTFFESADINQQSIQSGDVNSRLLTSTQAFKKNFLNAAARAFFLNVVVYSALVEPVTAFAVAAHSIPQPQDDGSWLWTYIFVENNIEYSIFLYGKPVEDHVEWRMEVSSTDTDMPLDHFVWFDGQTYNNESHGYWQFYEPSESPVPEYTTAEEAALTPGVKNIRIDWENVSFDEHSIIFLINKDGDPAEGSTLTFNKYPGMSSIEFYNTEEDATGTIIWYTDGSGSIEWPDYNNGMTSCWDTEQEDTQCQ